MKSQLNPRKTHLPFPESQPNQYYLVLSYPSSLHLQNLEV